MSGTELPDVVGLKDNVFWLNHQHLEDGGHRDAHRSSNANEWEVEITSALARHVIRQGKYSSDEIAVVPYTGQLRTMRRGFAGESQILLSDRDLETLAREGTSLEDGRERSSDAFRERRKATALSTQTTDEEVSR